MDQTIDPHTNSLSPTLTPLSPFMPHEEQQIHILFSPPNPGTRDTDMQQDTQSSVTFSLFLSVLTGDQITISDRNDRHAIFPAYFAVSLSFFIFLPLFNDRAIFWLTSWKPEKSCDTKTKGANFRPLFSGLHSLSLPACAPCLHVWQ